MKRCLTVILAMLLVVGCSAHTALPQPQLKQEEDPAQLADLAWAALSEDSSVQRLDKKTACLLLDLSADDLEEVYGFLEPSASQTAQLFLLKAAESRSDKVCKALEQRHELVRQTAAWQGEDASDNEYGCVLSAGQWSALLIPQNADDQRTKQARQIILEAFE